MPFYEYRCSSCGSVSEHLVGVGSDESDPACDACGSRDLKQLISLVSVNRGAAPQSCCGGDCSGQGVAGCSCDGACQHR